SLGGATIAGLDAESVSCVGCHDGSVAFDATFGLPTGQHARVAAQSMGNSHPIGVPYRTPDDWPSGAGLRSRFELDRRLRLFDDRLGCGTCHSVYSSRERLLVMSNDRSAMCLSCHKD
ncbi:MAG: hypothetical protein KDA22_12095, partial [Phycisphaerales bacterium]|nr:hypothetical protein [Phycisphaerales bacterium]